MEKDRLPRKLTKPLVLFVGDKSASMVDLRELLVEKGLAKSKSEVMRLLKQGAIKVYPPKGEG